MTDERKQWLKAAKQFGDTIDTTIECPSCRKGNLFFTDIAFDNNDLNKGGERIIECPNCKKFEVVLYRKKPKNWQPNTLPPPLS